MPARTGRKAGLIAVVAASLSIVGTLIVADREPRPTSTPPPDTASIGSSEASASVVPETAAPQGEIARRPRISPAPSVPATTPTVVPERGPGTFRTARAAERPTAGTTTYRVEVERGLPFDVDEVGSFVEATLADDRSWAAKHALSRVDGESDLRIVVASPATADSLCAPLDTGGRLSCRNGSDVVINGWRWQYGADSYSGELESYRRYVVNHETGHALGYGHVGCPARGELAPVMLQQTKGLGGCVANPWPARVDLVGH